jgi:hypothetical protein
MTLFAKQDVAIKTNPWQGQRIRIAFLLTHGFAARMVLRSGVARRLIAHGAEVVIISPNAGEAYFQQECLKEQVVLKQEPQSAGRVADWFRAYRSYLLDDVMHNVALKVKHELRSRDYPLSCFALAFVNRTVARSSLFRRLCRAFEYRINRSSRVRALLAELRPHLLVLPNPFGTHETLYLVHAKELGIPTVCQMLSWDNITSKGTPLLMPDSFISWGPIMTEEMVDLYHFPRPKIYQCGVSHFDVYFQKEQFTPREVVLQEMGLSLAYPYIFYGMVPPYSCPNEIDILAWLVERVNKDAFARPCSLVIRPHPQTISGVYARNPEELAKLRTLVGPRVALDIPPVLSEQLAWDLPKSDMLHLASLLYQSAMCLSANSTLSLDACMLDRPVINVAFDGWEEAPYERSARRGLDYIHMAKLLALGGIRVARSFTDLERHINAYLCDPCLDREGRAVSVAQECGVPDGHATERIAEVLAQLSRIGM